MTTTRATVYPEPVYADVEDEAMDSDETSVQSSDEMTPNRNSEDGTASGKTKMAEKEMTHYETNQISVR